MIFPQFVTFVISLSSDRRLWVRLRGHWAAASTGNDSGSLWTSVWFQAVHFIGVCTTTEESIPKKYVLKRNSHEHKNLCSLLYILAGSTSNNSLLWTFPQPATVGRMLISPIPYTWSQLSANRSQNWVVVSPDCINQSIAPGQRVSSCAHIGTCCQI